ncbi:MAG: hypothetical protein R2711_18505 [Acidimicrobiales bacterium]
MHAVVHIGQPLPANGDTDPTTPIGAQFPASPHTPEPTAPVHTTEHPTTAGNRTPTGPNPSTTDPPTNARTV